MELSADSQKSILIDTYMSRYNEYTAKSDLFKTLTMHDKNYYYIF